MATTNKLESRDNAYSRYLIRGNVTGNLGVNSAVRFRAIYGEGVDRMQVIRNLHRENVFRFWWYLLATLATIICVSVAPKDNWLAAIQIPLVLLCIDFIARGKVVGIVLAILDCIVYIVICSISGLWGEVIIQVLIYIPLNILSIINWTKNIKSQKIGKYQEKAIEIKRLNVKKWLLYIAAFVVALVGGYFLLRALNTSSLIVSTLAFAVALIAKVMFSQRYLESYVLFIVNQSVGLVLWVSMMIITGNPLAYLVLVVNKIACLTDNIYGLFLWRKMYRQTTVNGGVVLSKRKVNIKKVIKLRRMYQNLYWDKQVDIQKNS